MSSISPVTTRKILHYQKMGYPVHVISETSGFSARYLDLPGCAARAKTLPTLYKRLAVIKRNWIISTIESGQLPPLPNSSVV